MGTTPWSYHPVFLSSALLFHLLHACTAWAAPRSATCQQSLQAFAWHQWQQPQLARDRRLLQDSPAFPGVPSAVTLLGQDGVVVGSAGGFGQQNEQPGSVNKSTGNSTGSSGDASNDGSSSSGVDSGNGTVSTVASTSGGTTAQALEALHTMSDSNSSSSCPAITIYLRAIRVVHPLVNYPGSQILFQCETDTGMCGCGER
ncbi:hypothetical protein N2152v2_001822 [Parachlorella kessleri]